MMALCFYLCFRQRPTSFGISVVHVMLKISLNTTFLLIAILLFRHEKHTARAVECQNHAHAASDCCLPTLDHSDERA